MVRLLRLVRPRAARPAGAEDELLQLAEAAAAGDKPASRTLLTVLGPFLLRVVRRVLGAKDADLEDVAQEAAIELLRALPRFRRECSVKNFACRVALQTAMNARRRRAARKRGPVGIVPVVPDQVPSPQDSPEEQLAAKASVQLVRQLCDQLPEAQAEVLALHCVLGHTVSEVAAICGVPVETVRSRLRLAKHSLVDRALQCPQLRGLLEHTA